MFHLSAYHESIDPAGVLVPIAAVQDSVVTTQGDDIRVPADLPFIIGEGALLEATAALRAEIEAPSIRGLSNLQVSPFGTGLVFASGHLFNAHPYTPVPLRGGESINFLINSNPVAATSQYGLIQFGDGAQQPVTGEIITIRATASVTQVLGVWVNGNLTFDQDLPIGEYDIVGMRVVSATTVAARLVFVGGTYRPGIQAVGNEQGSDTYEFRRGAMGVWGSFNTNTPPTIDFLGAAGAVTPVVYLDIIARG